MRDITKQKLKETLQASVIKNILDCKELLDDTALDSLQLKEVVKQSILEMDLEQTLTDLIVRVEELNDEKASGLEEPEELGETDSEDE